MVSEITSILKNKSKRNSVDFFSSAKEIIIYGAGNTGRDVLRLLMRHGVQIKCFLDINAKSGENIDGIPVYSPYDDIILNSDKRDTVVLLALFNRDADTLPVLTNLKRLGYERTISFIEFHSYFTDELGDRFWLTSLDYYEGLDDVVTSVYKLLEDPLSRELYLSIIDFRMTGDCLRLPDPHMNQYFADDAQMRKPLRFIDCGAFDGDTVLQLFHKYGTVKSIAAFEPDLDNFRKLVSLVKSGEFRLADTISLWPCGVWSSSEQLNFSEGGGEAGSIKKDGSVTIQCVSLDDVLHGFQPDFIKMDIEGAEYDALLGAKKLIHDDLPDMAICVYHRPAHVWQIPLLIKSWDLGYRFYLRSYGYNGFDTVLYAVADKARRNHDQ